MGIREERLRQLTVSFNARQPTKVVTFFNKDMQILCHVMVSA